MPTQPPMLSGTGNEYYPKDDDALWLRIKIVIPVADKRVDGT